MDLMDHDLDAEGKKGSSMVVDCVCKMLPWPCAQLSSSKYVMDVKGISLPFAAHVLKRKLIGHLIPMAEMMVCTAQILGLL